MNSRQLRLVRAASASSVATLVAATSHTIAGGAAPHPLLMLAMATVLVPPAAFLIGARASRSRLALTVLASQAAFHLVFQVLGSPTGGAVTGGGGEHAHHQDLTSLGPVLASASPDAAMLTGHVIAAVLTSALLWRGESMVRIVAGWMLALLRHPVALIRPAHERPASLLCDIHPLVDAVVRTTVSRRGPPALA
ncbi:hypothetical protein [Microbacterium sp. SD291]|uniref:hypothetical protein n=1 Tax=Microbacterium sp. SD291 TaxID=2782007 RepID=UPI001A95EC77|nr:hypothetical protein [Microbacterium sp. SD291]MBO0980618.1 hypothetical protein [Microbacterium sp. SD291]